MVSGSFNIKYNTYSNLDKQVFYQSLADLNSATLEKFSYLQGVPI